MTALRNNIDLRLIASSPGYGLPFFYAERLCSEWGQYQPRRAPRPMSRMSPRVFRLARLRASFHRKRHKDWHGHARAATTAPTSQMALAAMQKSRYRISTAREGKP